METLVYNFMCNSYWDISYLRQFEIFFCDSGTYLVILRLQLKTNRIVLHVKRDAEKSNSKTLALVSSVSVMCGELYNLPNCFLKDSSLLGSSAFDL